MSLLEDRLIENIHPNTPTSASNATSHLNLVDQLVKKTDKEMDE